MAMCKEARNYTLLRAYGEIHAREMRYRHMIGNFLYDVTGNEATGQATFLATLATRSGFKFFGQGKYRDKLVKQNGHWLIAHRCVDVDLFGFGAEQNRGSGRHPSARPRSTGASSTLALGWERKCDICSFALIWLIPARAKALLTSETRPCLWLPPFGRSGCRVQPRLPELEIGGSTTDIPVNMRWQYGNGH